MALYNTAFNYLCDKYGKVFIKYTASFNKRIEGKSERIKKEIINSATESDKIYTYGEITDSDDVVIGLLLHQYPLLGSLRADKELAAFLPPAVINS